MNFNNPLSFFHRATDLFCLDNTPDYVQQACGAELGGIIALGFIEPQIAIDEDNVTATLEDATWWTGNVNTSPSSRFVVLNTRGSKAAGTPVEEEGYGLVPTERTGDDNELVFEALGVVDNRRFWASVNQRRNWQLVFVTAGTNDDGNYNAFYVKNVSVYADLLIEQSIKSRIRFSGSAKWSTAMVPALPFAFPAQVLTDLAA